MSVLFRISRRNLMEHKAKSYIIGIMIAIGVIVLVVGYAFLDTASIGIERAFINNYTSHVMISGIADGKISLFGVQSPGRMEETPTIPEFRKVVNYVESMEGVDVYSPQLTGFGIIGLPEVDGRAFTLMFGIEPESYHQLFDNINILEGRYLEPREEGIMLSVQQIDRIKEEIAAEQEIEVEELDIEFHAGDPIRINGFGNAGIKIREIPITGIFDFRLTAEGVGADLITYIDAQTVRALQGVSVVTQDISTLADEDKFLLESDELDSFFSEDAFTIEESAAVDLSDDALLTFLDDSSDTVDEDTIITDEAAEVEIDPTAGPWQYILLKLKNPRDMNKTVLRLNLWFKQNAIAAQAGTWEAAAGPFATTADVIRTVFNIALIIIGIVAIIIMMNTLVISIIERTSEIGTMRALGAKKGFVWRMFLYETLTITVVFGAIGIILALIIVQILNAIGIPANNTFLKILFAGDELHPQASPVSVITSVIIVMVIGFIAHLYPVSVALKIQPIKAIQSK